MRDQDTIRRFDLLELSRDDYRTILYCGLVLGVLFAVGLGIIGALWHFEYWVLGWIPPVIGVLYMTWMVWMANRRLNPEQRRRLSNQRELVRQEQRLRAACDSATRELGQAQAQANKLRDLALRLKRLGLGLVDEQIERTGDAAGLLEHLVRVDRELIAECQAECELLAAEIDALDVTPAVPAADLASRIAELEDLEEEIHARRRLRVAEEELSRYLREEAA